MRKSLLIGLLLFSNCAPILAQPPVRLTGMYSDMSFNNESGDVNGIEIFLVATRAGYAVVFQDAEGSPAVPVVVPATLKHGDIIFSLPPREGYYGQFIGHVAGGMLVGHFVDGQSATSGGRDFRLRRRDSYWQSP